MWKSIPRKWPFCSYFKARKREREKEKERKNAHIRKKEELLGQKMFIVVNQKLGDWKGVKYGETKINRVLIYFFL